LVTTSTSRRPWRIGIVGCGGIAHRHVAGYRAVLGDRIAITAACDTRPDVLTRFGDTHQIPHRFGSAAALAASGEVDVITLATPPAVREEAIGPAFEHGCHVLVEKPFTNSLPEAQKYVQEAEARGLLLAVNQNLRWFPDILLAREEIQSGRLGTALHASHDHYQWRRTQGWRGQEERLEIAIFSIHLLDRIRWVLGRPIEAVHAVTRTAIPGMGDPVGEVFASLLMQFAGGCTAVMTSEWRAPGLPECRLRIDATGGTFLSERRSATADEAQVTIVRGAGGQTSPPEVQPCVQADAFVRAFGESLRHLLDAVEQGVAPPHSGRDNLQTMAIVDAAYLSAARGGARVDIGEVLAG
jgi:D-apiose dehydrogenase